VGFRYREGFYRRRGVKVFDEREVFCPPYDQFYPYELMGWMYVEIQTQISKGLKDPTS
jgi:hypothetical protein